MATDDHPGDDARSKGDAFAMSMLFVAGISITQRAFGFLRNIGFCRFMEEGDVGQLAMALSFIAIASPIFLLGIPGSLTRFVEPYRRNGMLKPLIRRIAIGTAVLTCSATSVIACFPAKFAWFIFRDESNTTAVFAIVAALVTTVFFNFIGVLSNSLRKVRAASMMHFVQSVVFTMTGMGWLLAGGGISGLIAIYAGVTLVASLPGIFALLRDWPDPSSGKDTFCDRAFVRRVAPFAASLWLIDLASNLFDVSDRYMILHMTTGGTELGQAYVGEYFGSRVMPNLLLSIGVLISSTLMPYLTADWESKRFRKVIVQIKRTFAMMSASFTIIGAICSLAAPYLFGSLLGGRYELAEQILPLAFMVCIWISLITVTQDYLWCAERGRLVGYALVIGLVINVALNTVLLPMFGLYGAIFATSIANLCALLSLLGFMSREGYALSWSDLLASAIPATLLAGPWVALGFAGYAIVLDRQTRSYFRSTGLSLADQMWFRRASPLCRN